VARCICRRAERLVVHLATETEVNPIVPKYLNRLSDYLFMISRKVVIDSGAAEIAWRPRM
jgi:cob(I)alamin adenosyltransferase